VIVPEKPRVLLPCTTAFTPEGVEMLALTWPGKAGEMLTNTLMVLLNPLNTVTFVGEDADALKAATTLAV